MVEPVPVRLAQADGPRPHDDCGQTVTATPITLPVTANDASGPGPGPDVVAFTTPEHGRVEALSDGALQYRPDADFAGVDRFTYQLAQGGGRGEAFLLVNPATPGAVQAAATFDPAALPRLAAACAASTSLAQAELAGAEVTVPAPEPGQRLDVAVEPGQRIVFADPAFADARYLPVDGGLLVLLPDGRLVFLDGFAAAATGENPPVLAVGEGGAVSGADLLAGLDPTGVVPAFGEGETTQRIPTDDGGTYQPLVLGALGPDAALAGLLVPTSIGNAEPPALQALVTNDGGDGSGGAGRSGDAGGDGDGGGNGGGGGDGGDGGGGPGLPPALAVTGVGCVTPLPLSRTQPDGSVVIDGAIRTTVAMDGIVDVTDVDSTALSSARAAIVADDITDPARREGDSLQLGERYVVDPDTGLILDLEDGGASTGISLVPGSTPSELLFTGEASLETYEAVLGSIEFFNANPDITLKSGTRTIGYDLTDAEGNTTLDAARADVEIQVAVIGTDGDDADLRGSSVSDPEPFSPGGNDLIIGKDGDDFIDGASGNDIILGGAGDDVIIGHRGNDVIVGEQGFDILTGDLGNRPGSDIFVFLETEPQPDVITDYSASEGDRLGLGQLLEGFDPESSDINEFVRLTAQDNGRDVLVEVDVDGAAGPAGFTPLVLLQNPEGVTIDQETGVVSGVIVGDPRDGDGFVDGAGPCDTGTFVASPGFVVSTDPTTLAEDDVLDSGPGIAGAEGGSEPGPAAAAEGPGAAGVVGGQGEMPAPVEEQPQAQAA